MTTCKPCWNTCVPRSSQPTIVFAAQGGVFSEGVDYPGGW